MPADGAGVIDASDERSADPLRKFSDQATDPEPASDLGAKKLRKGGPGAPWVWPGIARTRGPTMRGQLPPTPRIQVRERAEVVLSREEVEHCLRCWVDRHLALAAAPKAKDFSKIDVRFEVSGIDDYATLKSVTLIYEPERAGCAAGDHNPSGEAR